MRDHSHMLRRKAESQRGSKWLQGFHLADQTIPRHFLCTSQPSLLRCEDISTKSLQPINCQVKPVVAVVEPLADPETIWKHSAAC